MSFNSTDIVNAWISSFNPTETELKRATKRAQICHGCDYSVVKLKINICNKCKCPISKKIYSHEFNPCPEKMWLKCDEEFFGVIKNNNTLI